MNHDLRKLYESTAEDLIYGVGLFQLPNAGPVPLIHIHYRGWSREKLEVVCESFKSGLILVSGRRKNGNQDLYIATREQIALHQKEGADTSILRAPAWDAHLAQVEEQAYAVFEAQRRRSGGFLLLVQTPAWECLTVVDDCDQTIVGDILPRSLPVPPGATGM
jgi:hypothetical protein